jgi:hypothetical protein
MPLYFLVHDAEQFHHSIRPALAAGWQQRSFAPCRPLCGSLVAAARDFAERFHVAPEEALLFQVAQGLPFDRNYWRLLVGEVMLYGAADVPEFPTAPDSLCCLLAAEHYREQRTTREQFAAIQRAHFGARDLVLGSAFYRPEHAGYNDSPDVAGLAEYLRAVGPEQWSVAGLRDWREASDDEERAEELEFARECFATLREFYQRTAAAGQLIVCELL